MLEYYLEIFEQTAIMLIDWIPGVIVLWIVFNLMAGLFFNKA